MNTPANVGPGANTFTTYENAISNFTLIIDGFGTGTGNSGRILLGDPVQTSGSFNFLSDQYVVSADVSGITIPSSFG